MRRSSNDIREISGGGVGSERWYVAQTQPGAKSRTVVQLERQGYQVFCPRFRTTVHHARKARQVLAPLFPNYLFLHLDTACGLWRAVNSTGGVVRLISRGEAPTPLPQAIVEGLLAKADARGVVDWTPTSKVGQAVRIARGPFVDLVGKLEHLDAASHVRVMLELLGRHVSVAFRCEALIAVA